jgi:hypothetical protein
MGRLDREGPAASFVGGAAGGLARLARSRVWIGEELIAVACPGAGG